MKKLLLILTIPLLMGAGCTISLDDNNSDKVKELEQKIEKLEAEQQTEEDTSEVNAISEEDIIEETAKVTDSPSNNTLTCSYGYSMFGGSCVKIPENAHAVNNGADAWLCNEGYEEYNNTCQKKEVPQQNDEEEEKESDEILIAKCKAQKESLEIKGKALIEKYYQDKYFEILEMIDASDNCADGILPETIAICRDGHATLARNEATKLTKEYETTVNSAFAKVYSECLNGNYNPNL